MAETRYTKNGEWVRFDGTTYQVGLTAAAVADLGDVTFVELPTLGRTVVAGEAVCAVEAVKAAADFYVPVAGTITATNARLGTDPTLLNRSPDDEAWFFSLADVGHDAFSLLLDAEAWKLWEAGR